MGEQATAVTVPVLGELTYREIHAFQNGVYVGARWGERPHEYTQERHYWRMGYLIGTGMRYLLVAYVVRWIRKR